MELGKWENDTPSNDSGEKGKGANRYKEQVKRESNGGE